MTHNSAPRAVTRRNMLQSASAGFGAMALSAMCQEASAAQVNPLAPKLPHFPAKAKRVIFLFMRGGPSQMETFEYKPRLNADHGKPVKDKSKIKYFGSQWKFKRYGESGHWVSDLFPQTAQHVDELCQLHAMHTDHTNHPQAMDQLHTGSFQFERPSMGSWVLYGLGSENKNVPGFICVKPPVQWGGARYYGSSFLPSVYQGTPIGTMTKSVKLAKVSNVVHPHLTQSAQRQQLDYLRLVNERTRERTDADSVIEGLIESHELAFRMQSDLPELINLSNESQETLDLYGIGDGKRSDDFGRQCLMARRFAESGVRFIELTHDNWDHHSGVAKNMPLRCEQTDQPIAGLLVDLRRRGLLDETLVVWGGEFGRTPDDPTSDGRGHNAKGFTMWLAGGGVKRAYIHGKTDDYGYQGVEGRVHMHDLHATILHLMGLDHRRLTYRYAGRDFRLTDVHGQVVHEVIA
jgi:hypothetical protein